MEETPILSSARGNFRVITLNRPQRLNSFNEAMHAALQAALDEAERDTQCRALLVTGAGRGFCAGQDLSDRNVSGGNRPDLGHTIGTFYNPLVKRIKSLPFPTVCAVNGVAAGAGANIALAFDIVLAARSANFIQAFAKIALVPDSGGTWFLPQLAGAARARGLAMLAEPLSAEKAESWGLIWKAVDDAALMEEAGRICEQLANGPTAALVEIRNALAAAETNTLEQQLELERKVQAGLGAADDYAEGVKAFMEKRGAKFSARKAG
ncbi:MAG TPA: 2-(1,2-epoxy-1,2-dihydrophenyl)acetyl-CoA isomerase PaaG [Xanthobacteraceae bacterium]|nr:2-(1,2-epoxy-1,2-dihydrophenyl)acetyl-CoA isomerase PaaG [Xanthobacteraceae bacterium]